MRVSRWTNRVCRLKFHKASKDEFDALLVSFRLAFHRRISMKLRLPSRKQKRFRYCLHARADSCGTILRSTLISSTWNYGIHSRRSRRYFWQTAGIPCRVPPQQTLILCTYRMSDQNALAIKGSGRALANEAMDASDIGCKQMVIQSV